MPFRDRTIVTLFLIFLISTGWPGSEPRPGQPIASTRHEMAGPHQGGGEGWIERETTRGGATVGLSIFDGLAYVGEGRHLAVYDVSEPGPPRQRSRQLLAPDTIVDVEVTTDRVYLAHSRGIEILDRSQAESPAALAHIDGAAHALAASDEYLLASGIGVQIYDAGDWANPRPMMVYREYTRDILLHDGFAYLATEVFDQPLVVVDLHATDGPAIVTQIEEIWETPVALALEGARLFVQTEEGEIYIVDIGDPTQPEILATANCGIYVQSGLDVADGLAISVSWFDMAVCDLSQVEDPEYLAELDRFDGDPDLDHGTSRAVEIVGDRVFLAGYDHGLLVMDLGDPREPAVVEMTGQLGASTAVAVQEDRLLSANQTGLSLLDPSQAGTAQLLDQLGIDFVGSNLEIQNGMAFAGGFDGMAVVDLEAPDGLALKGQIYPYGNVFVALDVQADHAFVGTADGGLQIFDVSEPEYPQWAARFGDSTYGVDDVLVDGDRAYLVEGSTLHILDITEPIRPRELGRLTVDELRTFNVLALRDDRLFVGGFRGGLIVDVSDPTAPHVVVLDPALMRVYGAQVEGGRLYLYRPGSGLEIRDWSLPDALPLVNRIPDPASSRGFDARGDQLFVAGDDGLWIFDVSDPESVVQTAMLTTETAAMAVLADGDRLWLAEGSRLHLVDIGDPAAPEILTTQAIHYGTGGLVLEDGRLYGFGRNTGWLEIFEPQGAQGATRLGAYSAVWRVEDLVVEDDLAWLAAGAAGLRAVDVSDPERPAEIGYSLDLDFAESLAVWGDHALVVDLPADNVTDPFEEEIRRVVIFDLSDPRRPSPVAAFQAAQGEKALAVSDGIAYVAEGQPSSRLHLFDLQEPASPRRLGAASWLGESGMADLVVDGGLVWTVSDAGLRLFDVRDPSQPCAVDLLPGLARPAGLVAEAGGVHVAEGSAGLSTYRWTGSLPEEGCASPNMLYLPKLFSETHQP